MITIKIDEKLPQSCYQCKLYVNEFCTVQESDYKWAKLERPFWCPIEEDL